MNEQHNIRLVVETVLKDQGVLKKVAADLNRLDQQNKKSSNTWRNLKSTMLGVTAAYLGLQKVVTTVYKAASEGADMLFVESKFARWAEQVGTTADALMHELVPAARGTASEFDIMKMSLDLMSLGLAKNHEQVVRLSNVAVKLGMNMDQLVLTLTNKTIRRFDSLGISVDGFKERWGELKETMSDEDAFTMAFLEQAEKQLAITGEAADNIKGTYMGLEAAWADYANVIKKDLAVFLEGTARWLAEMLNAHNAIRRSARDFQGFMEATGGMETEGGFFGGASFMDESLIYQGYDNVLKGYLTFGTDVGQQLMAHGEATELIKNMNFALDNLGWTMDDFNFKTVEEMAAFNMLMDAYYMGVEDVAVFEQTLAEANETMEEAEEETLETTEALGNYLNLLDPSRVNLFRDALEKMNFAQAGGEETIGFSDLLFDADGNLKDLNLTLDETTRLLQEGEAASLATKVNMGEMSLWKARQDLFEIVRDWDTVWELLPDVATAMENITISEGALKYMEIMGGDLETARDAVIEIWAYMGNLDGLTSVMRIKIIQDMIQGSTQDDWDPTVPSSNPFGWQNATGGPLTGGIHLVGEEGEELVINGIVIPTPISRALMGLGLRPGPGKKHATGGLVLDGQYVDGFNMQSYMNYTPPTYGAGGVGVAGTASDPSYSPDAEVAAAQVTAETTARTSAQTTKTVTEKVAEQISMGDAAATKQLGEIYDVLLKQPTQDGLTAAMRSALQEALAS